MASLLYVDTSALLDRALGQKRHADIADALHDHGARGDPLVSSRLLHLEVRRVQVREGLAGHDLAGLGLLADQVVPLPLTEEVWVEAHRIEQHAKTLDALHLGTCRLVEADLLCSGAAMLEVAIALGISIHPASG